MTGNIPLLYSARGAPPLVSGREREYRSLMQDGHWPRELEDVLARGAQSGQGLAFIAEAPVEAVATSLGVHAHSVDRARDCLEDPARRARAVRELERLSTIPPPPEPTTMRPPAAPRDIIEEAENHPLGVQFLLCAPLETAAISFGVHPDAIDEARERLAARGIVPKPGEE